ncbi:carbonic anhydrase [Streptomyces sp. NPDC050625]|uniref:carbonic anhydrase n=1 Tax=Streptomyces sp. NPDC050625 TaxID=3154629 RepID=UPI003426E6ED
MLGSIEYGVSMLGCPLVVVLGHDTCGAVPASRAAVDEGTTADGCVRDVVKRVTPASAPPTPPRGPDLIAEHVRATVALLADRSRELAEAVAVGRTAIVGLSYCLADGRARVVAVHGIDLPADQQANVA